MNLVFTTASTTTTTIPFPYSTTTRTRRIVIIPQPQKFSMTIRNSSSGFHNNNKIPRRVSSSAAAAATTIVGAARDRVIDFGKYKGKMLGSLPSSYLKWVTNNLRAGDTIEWAILADEVLADPVYRDRIEWELADKILNGEDGLTRMAEDRDVDAVSELLEISHRFGWDNDDKVGWGKIDFRLLGTSKGGRIPRKRTTLLTTTTTTEDDNVGKVGTGGSMTKTNKNKKLKKKNEEEMSRGRKERRERVLLRRQQGINGDTTSTLKEEEEKTDGNSTTTNSDSSLMRRSQMQRNNLIVKEERVVVGGRYGDGKYQRQVVEESSNKVVKVNEDNDASGRDTRAVGGGGVNRNPFPGREALLNKVVLNRGGLQTPMN